MTLFDTTLFPFPHWLNGKMQSGSAVVWPDECLGCRRQVCKKSESSELQLCSYGYNYIAINRDITLAGILVREFQSTNEARNKRMSSEKKSVITKTMLRSSIDALLGREKFIEKEIDSKKSAAIENYIENEQYKTDFLASLREEIQKGLSFVHDYKQVNTQIVQNINVVIENRYVGQNLDEKLAKATREERAIYEASKFLDEKLNVAKFLMHPEWLDLPEECVHFRFHGIVLKYRRIYSPRFEEKGLDIRMHGMSYAEVLANALVTSVIPHTLIDNAAKYSPKGGKVEILTNDTGDAIRFEVSSFGPRILPEEKKKIFQPFYRAEAAKQVEEEGAGYGLYLAQMIAKRHFHTEINVEQEPQAAPGNVYWTKFHIIIPLRAAIL